MAHILVIDDDELVRFTAQLVLASAGHAVDTANDGREGVEKVRRVDYDVVVTDMIMPEMEGLETIQILIQEFPQLPIVAMSGGGPSGRLDYLQLARNLGVRCSLEKPFSHEELCAVVDKALDDS